MNKFIITLSCILSLAFLVGCNASIKTKVNTFRLEGVELGAGTIKVVRPEGPEYQSLEYAFYADKLASALPQLGYQIVSNDQESEYVAFLNYGVSETQVQSSSPFSHWHFGLNSSLMYRESLSGNGVVVVQDDRRRTLYVRTLELVIANAKDIKERVYESRGKSVGHCESLTPVFDEMLQAIIQLFPSRNGSLETIVVRGDADC